MYTITSEFDANSIIIRYLGRGAKYKSHPIDKSRDITILTNGNQNVIDEQTDGKVNLHHYRQ